MSNLTDYENNGTPVDNSYPIDTLRAIAFRIGIRDYQSMTKKELVAVLNDRLARKSDLGVPTDTNPDA